ncbi:hypothetical protein [Virgibacillus sp. DJP39]|uniref:hypothetical protein n=1 Tax=Virgibacillus sp. DJP39 TaxID=3409790 RepID=UPI003BB7034B
MEIEISEVIVRGRSNLVKAEHILDVDIKFKLIDQDYCWTWLMVQPGNFFYSYGILNLPKPEFKLESSIFIPTEEVKHEYLLGMCSECGGFSKDNCYTIYNKPREWVTNFFDLVSVKIAAREVDFEDSINHKR